LVEMLGYDTKDDIIGRLVYELYTPESAKTVKKKIFPEFKKNGIIEDKELQIQKKNGKIKDVNLNVSSVRDEKGNILHSRSSWRDITERKEAERRNVFASEILQIMNKSSERKDIIRHILEKIKEFTGFEAVAIRLKEGEDFPYYSTSGFPGYFVEAEKYLCQRDADGEILRDILGKPYLECMCGNILCGRTDVKYEFFTEGGSFWSNNTTKLLSTTSDEDRQTRTRNRCNSEGYESVALIPLRSENETIGLLQFNDSHTDMFNIEMIEFFEGIGYSIGIALSIKKTEEVLVDTKNQLYRSERLAATGRLAASIAHEINNPLQAMRSHIGIIEKNMPEDIPVQESIEQTNIGIDRIGHIVKQLLDLHREKNRARDFTDVNTVIESTLDMMKNQLDINKIVVKYDLRKHLPPVKADQQELVQVFMNMFINAQDAMYDGGELTISTRPAKQKVIIDIKDSGVGMTDDEMEHIFEPFFSTKEMSLGNGLGLSISKSIIDSYQGEITVNSEPGKGSKFTITLPLPKYQENKYE
ncbi:MAG: PAS domain S-box protein, partial [bacterium]|nr:PAS domain S-box protein [bacterium]